MNRKRLACAIALLVALASGCGVATPLPQFGLSPSADTSWPAGSAAEALTRLEVKGRAPRTGYERDRFGDGWTDRDSNGCSTRDDILLRDSAKSTLGSDSCITEVLIVDPYTGETVAGRDSIDIDHVVALSDAWQKGAQLLTEDQREELANDPLNLLAVRDSVNSAKGDSDAATWLPPRRDFWCAFVARQIAVKTRYALWVTEAERDAMRRVLDACPQEPLPSESA